MNTEAAWSVKIVQNTTMKNTFIHIAHIMAVLCLLPSAQDASAQQPDSVTAPYKGFLHRGIVGKVVEYFETSNQSRLTERPTFSFIGGPHYSSDTGFGIGLVAAGLYSENPADTTLLPSNISITADLTTSLFFKFGVNGLHLMDRGNRRVGYNVSFISYKTYYWGIGYQMARRSENKTKYLLLDLQAEIENMFRFSGSWLAGPLLSLNYVAARKIENPEIWGDQPTRFVAAGLGGKLEYDSRDNYTAPNRGWKCELVQRFFPKWLGNSSHPFGETEFGVNNYSPVWTGGVIATRVHGILSYGDTPWGMMPSLGGSERLRGYYEGQYRDKCEMDATVELRQHIKGRSGIAVWGGAGAVFPSFGGFNGRDVLPTYGAGYRWEFKKLTNVRVDVGFGKGCWGVVLNINEAF